MARLAGKTILVRFPLHDKTLRPKAARGGKGLFQLTFPHCSLSSKEVQAETWRQERKQKPQRCAVVYWLVLHGVLSLFPYHSQDHQHQGQGKHCPQWAGHQSLIKKISQGLAHRPVSWRCLLSWDSLFPDDSGLCQVDMKTSQHRKSAGVTPSTAIKEELLYTCVYAWFYLFFDIFILCKMYVGHIHPSLLSSAPPRTPI